MKAVVVHQAKDIRLDTIPDFFTDQNRSGKQYLGKNQVLVQVAKGGICGSDLHYYHHGGFGMVRLKEPMVLGHEISAFILEIGDHVQNLHQGHLVAVSPSRPCYHCSFCSDRMYNHCLHMRFYGSAMVFPHIQGAFQELLIVEAEQCIPAEGLSRGEAALAEPLAVALHATKQLGCFSGKRILITGSGPIGALCILAARWAGAEEIVVTDLSDYALQCAASIGADCVINSAREPERLLPYASDKGYFDIAYECSGSADALKTVVAVLKPRGRLVQLGLGGDMLVPMMLVTAKELTLCGSFRFHEEFVTAVELMRQGLINVKNLLTHQFALKHFRDAFQMASDRNQAMKVQIDFQSG